IAGPANSAFPDGAPKPAKKEDDKAKSDDKAKQEPAKGEAKDAKSKDEKVDAAPAKPHTGSGRVNAIVVADADMLNDQFWVEVREFLGQQVAIPNASNAAFVVNALDNLSGSDALIALRGRGADDRPFKLVNDIRRQ